MKGETIKKETTTFSSNIELPKAFRIFATLGCKDYRD